MSEWYDRPKPAEQLEKLEAFVGEWASIDQHESMPWMNEGGSGITRNVFKKALDGFCYFTDIEADTPFGNIKGHGFIFYDSEIQKFRIEWYDNFGNHLFGEGDFNESTQSLQFVEYYKMGGVDVVERHTSTKTDESHYTHVVDTLIDGEFKLTSTLYYKRVV